MEHRLPGAVSYLCLLLIAATLNACATGHELRETSKKFEDQTETVRSSLDSKIEQLKRTQVAAEKNLAKLEQLIEENKREQTQTRELAAKLNSDVRGFREMDLTKVEGRIERAKRDIEALQGKVEDQVSSLQQNAQQWLATLDQKQSAKLDQQVTKVDQQVAKVEGRLEGLDKREAVASKRIEDTLTTLGKKIDERLGPQEARIKKLEDDQRAATTKFTTHLGEVDKNLAQISDTVKTVGAKLSTQLEQQGGSLGKLEEATKQENAQLRTLAPRVDQLKSSLGELAKVLHTLTEKSSEIDRRVTELGGQTEGKVGTLAVQGGEQSARLEKLAKRLEIENQAVTGHLNTVTQSVNGLAKSLEGVQGRVGELQSRIGDASLRQDDTQGARIDALTKSLNETMTAVNDTTRAIGDLKHVLDTSLGKLASRVDEQGDTLHKLALQQGVRTVSATQGANQPEAQPGGDGAAKPSEPSIVTPGAPAESAYEKAYQEFQQNRHESALALFQQFLSQHPDSNLVPNAHFWIAECYVKKRDYQRSLTAYEQVIRNHPKSGKASIALYRKALVLIELNDKPAAKTALKRLITDYPRSEESKQARIKLGSLQ